MATAQAPKAYEVKEGAAQDVDITWANDITKVDLFIAGGLYEWKGNGKGQLIWRCHWLSH
jgi:hypothetical protein